MRDFFVIVLTIAALLVAFLVLAPSALAASCDNDRCPLVKASQVVVKVAVAPVKVAKVVVKAAVCTVPKVAAVVRPKYIMSRCRARLQRLTLLCR